MQLVPMSATASLVWFCCFSETESHCPEGLIIKEVDMQGRRKPVSQMLDEASLSEREKISAKEMKLLCGYRVSTVYCGHQEKNCFTLPIFCFFLNILRKYSKICLLLVTIVGLVNRGCFLYRK